MPNIAPNKDEGKLIYFTHFLPYKIFYGLIIRLFILTGVGIVVSIVAGFWFSYDSSSELKRIIFILLIVASSAAFFIALLLQSLKQLQQD